MAWIGRRVPEATKASLAVPLPQRGRTRPVIRHRLITLPTILLKCDGLRAASDQPRHHLSPSLGETKPLSKPSLNAGERALKTKKLAKSELLKKVAARRPTAPVNDEHANGYRVQGAAPVTRLSLLDIIKERFGQTPSKIN
jgi:hypothetical protein